MTTYYPQSYIEEQWLDINEEKQAMTARKLRPALEIVSDIGALGFDLQHHSEAEIAHAVALLRTVNPEMFRWLSRALEEPPSVAAVDPVAASHPTDEIIQIANPEARSAEGGGLN